MSQEAWQWLSNVASILQIVTVAFTAASGVYFLWRARQLERRLAALATQVSQRPVALAVGLGGSIAGHVRHYLSDNGLEMEVVGCNRTGMVERTEYPTLLREIQELRGRLDQTGVTEVHVFYRGPVTFAIALGALLRNWAPAKLYNFEGGTYVLHMRLDKESVIAP